MSAPVGGLKKPGGKQCEQLTEDAVALAFAEKFQGRLRYCHTRGRWFFWNGSIWQPNVADGAFHCARKLARDKLAAAEKGSAKTPAKAAFTGGVLRMARTDPKLSASAETWDRDTLLLGAPGVTIDLTSGDGRAPAASDGITKSVAVAPAATSHCPLFGQFLQETFGDDRALIRFIQQFFGYCLTGDVSEHALIFGYGGGGNGKSVLLNTIVWIMGDYAVVAAMDTFTASRNEKHPTDLAMLAGARLVTASETTAGKSWDEGRIKQLTGGDVIQARFMRQDFFSYRPQFKLVIVGNHKPELHNVDDAARRRFNMVPFNFKPPKPDPKLEEKLRQEGPGILRWLIEGCLDWQANGLVRPDVVRAATETYFSDQDLVGQWIDDECDVALGDSTFWEPTGELYAAFQNYAKRSGEVAGNAKWFKEAMQRRGFEYYRTSGQRRWRGLSLKAPQGTMTGDT